MDIAALDSAQVLRENLLKWICFCFGILASVFTYFNLFINDFYSLGILEGVFAIYCFYTFNYARTRKFQTWQPLLLCLCIMLLVILGTYLAVVKSGLFVWTFTLPILFYLLLGCKCGFYLSLLLVCVQTAVFISKPSLAPFSELNLYLNMSFSYVIVWVTAHIFEASRAQFSERLENLALLDPLTNTGNRLAMNHYFEVELVDKINLFIMVLDLDYFKKVNDEFGHDVGDQVLVEIATILRETLNKGRVFRTGGEEFALFIPDSNQQESYQIAENIRVGLQSTAINVGAREIILTASIGLAAYRDGDSLKQAIKAADEQLYYAKKHGRNNVYFDSQQYSAKLEQVS
ncbi:GGDEF domain-containing protein [Pseudoalteromonas sp. SG44-17]|uniref:GGDEF domain-containing protein n=1 Tax=Pseudoalteromonas sp. SG44-17 TaxID=2760963 RepID=UPI00160442C2|nr:GGDEF domain-containing protein [Pseudoalteromonas sp. SG44-17]